MCWRGVHNFSTSSWTVVVFGVWRTFNLSQPRSWGEATLQGVHTILTYSWKVLGKNGRITRTLDRHRNLKVNNASTCDASNFGPFVDFYWNMVGSNKAIRMTTTSHPISYRTLHGTKPLTVLKAARTAVAYQKRYKLRFKTPRTFNGKDLTKHYIHCL